MLLFPIFFPFGFALVKSPGVADLTNYIVVIVSYNIEIKVIALPLKAKRAEGRKPIFSCGWICLFFQKEFLSC
jgi:hypothetical protein